MYLIFDTETTGLPKSWNAPISDTDNWPRVVQIAWQLHDELGNLIENDDFLIQPDGFDIPYDAERVHGISTHLAEADGIPLERGLQLFNQVLKKTKFVVGQNLSFDINIMGCEFYRLGIENNLTELPVLDTCSQDTANLCEIKGGRGGKFKFPTLTELHRHLFGTDFLEAHNASADVEATTRCFLELIRRQVYTLEQLKASPDYFQRFADANPDTIKSVGLKHVNLKKKSDKIREQLTDKADTESKKINSQGLEKLKQVPFAHLHNHTQYSVLQSTTQIENMVKAAAQDKMNAVAITDIGNMMGAFRFVETVLRHNKKASQDGESPEQTSLKPIVGCELYVCENHQDRAKKDRGYQIVFLAKNKNGYHNLAKMSSIGFVDGFYYVPRIDREIVKKYKEDLIVLTGNLNGEVPSKILNTGEKQAEEALLWWKEEFGDDLYIELIRHDREDEKAANKTLIKFAEKHKIKTVATNNTFYLKQEDANAHDILLCVKEGEKQSTEKGKGRGKRYGLPNEEYYFKSSEAMKSLFADIPEAILNIQEIVEKVEPFSLEREVLLPAFDIPEEFQDKADQKDNGKRGENNYLRHLTYQGFATRYPDENEQIKQRIDFELEVIANTGYPGYFLIVQDFIEQARRMGVSVGPGRGSVAGSVVAYCLKITNIDPLRYNLLFERFLNPDRISMPDIDIDFDDEGRGKVINYVIDKYGANQVAQIITYGKMAAKSAIRDTARVLDLPLSQADSIAKLIPNVSLKTIFEDDPKSKEKRSALRSEDKAMVNQVKNLVKKGGLEAETISKARVLEGSVRNVGTHACGIIITPDDITNFVPVALAKDSNMYVTQFDNAVVEDAGLLKMDFLGLKTLTIIRDAVEIVRARQGISLDPDNFPLDDQKTYQLFQKGATVGIFQYESAGMQKYLRELKPTTFEDIIAMNALYRPGPIEYIPSFIRRKHRKEAIEYDLPEMESFLKETYGITVYQEQVMLLSQKLANFTRGEADVLRKAMGKKQIAVLEKMKPQFIEQATANGHEPKILEKIWVDWEAFASYAFNKSHATCYAWIAYQTAYLKAHYPGEYMAAVLSNNMKDIKEVSFFMEECRRMGLQVLGPDINESYLKFSVNKQGAIRFGMAAIKGVGASAVKEIVSNRKKNGNYTSIFDLAKRVNLRTTNKRAFEGLVLSGSFDSFTNTHRAQYFLEDEKGQTFLEKAIKYGAKLQENKNSAQGSLFGESSEVQLLEPTIPPCDKWGPIEQLGKEKQVVGFYISAHPLDNFKNELAFFCKRKLSDFKVDLKKYEGQVMSFGGIITGVKHMISKSGKPWGVFSMEDYSDTVEFRIFGEEYLENKNFLEPNFLVFVKASIKPGWVNKEGVKGDVRIQFNDFKFLQDIMDEYCKKITLKISLNQIDDDFIANLEKLINQHKGSQILNLNICDHDQEIEVDLLSRNTKVKVNNELLSALENRQIPYKLN